MATLHVLCLTARDNSAGGRLAEAEGLALIHELFFTLCTNQLAPTLVPQLGTYAGPRPATKVPTNALIADGTLEELQRQVRPNTRWTLEAAAPAAELASSVKGIEGVANVRLSGETDGRTTIIIDHAPEQEIWRALNTTLNANNWPIAQLAPEQLSLEQIFLELTDHPLAQSQEVEQ